MIELCSSHFVKTETTNLQRHGYSPKLQSCSRRSTEEGHDYNEVPAETDSLGRRSCCHDNYSTILTFMVARQGKVHCWQKAIRSLIWNKVIESMLKKVLWSNESTIWHFGLHANCVWHKPNTIHHPKNQNTTKHNDGRIMLGGAFLQQGEWRK